MSEANVSPETGKQAGTRNTSLFDFYSRPRFVKALPIALQHLLAMIAGVITPPIIVAGVVGASPQEQLLLVQIAVLASGVCTLCSPVWRVEVRRPAAGHFWRGLCVRANADCRG